LLCLAEGVAGDEVEFGELGYLREAKGSYLDFCAARDRGELPRDARFQVCLPTPLGVIYAFCTRRDLTAIEAAYERAMIREVETICRAIPHRDLCIQWDFCDEMVILDGQPQDWFPVVNGSMPEIMARMERICAPVPDDVELGIHLCYGDFGAKHFIEPVDARRMVEVANALTQSIKRPITYIHMPVPLTRTDDEFFKPFSDLKLAPETELYLGLVHATDGADGTRRRMDTARKYVADFGVATECGMARARKPALVRDLLKIHAEVCNEPAA
jgi:methionine synthase II (cobalamin-independent)